MSDIVEFRHLEYLVAIAERKNFSKAAEHVLRSQPAVSHQIKMVEADIGYPLLVRDGRNGVYPTPAGEFVLAWAKIVLPERKVDWVFDGGHVASRFISVKPKTAGGSTDIHIVSDHGNEYTLQLREVSGDDDAHYDSKVLIEPADKSAKDKLAQLPVFVPAADLDKAKQEAVAAQAAETATLKAEQTKEETYRSQYPGSLHFDFAWDEKKGKELGLQQIWRDDKFTHLRGQFQETPALYEVKDKKPSLINFDFSNGLYIVPKELDNGYLAIGKQKVDFHRTTEGR
jgi:hypothetical protein